MSKPKCPVCKGPIGHEPASPAGPERVYCVCGWSLYRPDQPAVVVEKQVGKQEGVPAKPTQKPVVTTLNHELDWVTEALAIKTALKPTPINGGTTAMTTTNTLSDLNDLLFGQLRVVANANTSGDKLKEEIDRTRAITGLAKGMIDNARLALEVQHTLGGKDKPGMLAIESK